MKIEEAIQQKKIDDPYSKAIINLLYTNSYIVSHQSRFFRGYGISPEQYNVLRILRGQHSEPMSVSSIQERMLNKMSNASRLVEKLTQKGLAIRTERPSDRRQVDVTISPEGQRLLGVLEEGVTRLNREILHLNPEELEELSDLLDKARSPALKKEP